MLEIATGTTCASGGAPGCAVGEQRQRGGDPERGVVRGSTCISRARTVSPCRPSSAASVTPPASRTTRSATLPAGPIHTPRARQAHPPPRRRPRGGRAGRPRSARPPAPAARSPARRRAWAPGRRTGGCGPGPAPRRWRAALPEHLTRRHERVVDAADRHVARRPAPGAWCPAARPGRPRGRARPAAAPAPLPPPRARSPPGARRRGGAEPVRTLGQPCALHAYPARPSGCLHEAVAGARRSGRSRSLLPDGGPRASERDRPPTRDERPWTSAPSPVGASAASEQARPKARGRQAQKRPGRRSRARARRTRASPSRGRCSRRSPWRSRPGSSRALPPAGRSRRRAGACP